MTNERDNQKKEGKLVKKKIDLDAPIPKFKNSGEVTKYLDRVISQLGGGHPRCYIRNGGKKAGYHYKE